MIPTTFRIRIGALIEALRAKDVGVAGRVCDSLGMEMAKSLLTDAGNYNRLEELLESSLRGVVKELETVSGSEEFVTALARSLGSVRTVAPHIVRLLLVASRFTEAEALAATHGFKLDYKNFLHVLAPRTEVPAGIEYLASHINRNEPGCLVDAMWAIYCGVNSEAGLDRCIKAFGLTTWRFTEGRTVYPIRATMPIDLIPRMLDEGMDIEGSTLNTLSAFWGGLDETTLEPIVRRVSTNAAMKAMTSMIGIDYSEDGAAAQTRSALKRLLLLRLCKEGYNFVLLNTAIQKKDVRFAMAIPAPIAPTSVEARERLLKTVLDGYSDKSGPGQRWKDTIAWLRVLQAWGEDFSGLRRPMRETVELLLSA